MKIAVDVSPILPGGEGGGAKQLVLGLLHGMAERSPSDRFLLLTTSKNHHVFEEFEEKHGMRRCRIDAPEKNPLTLFKRLGARLGLKRSPALLRRHGISVLFCPMTAPFHAEPGVPTVSLVYDLQHAAYPEFFSDRELTHRRRLYEQLRNKAEFFICISEYTKKDLINRLQIPGERVTAIPIAVQSRLQDLAGSPPLPELAHCRYLIYPANLWPHKNHRLLLEAFKMFCQNRPDSDMHLVLTGAKIEHDRSIEELVKEQGIKKRVHFLGYLSEPELASVWRNAFALVFPSLFEGFGIPLVEAMMFQKPILASNVTSIPEVAGEAALYFDPRKPKDIAFCLARLLDEEGLYEKLVATGSQQLKKFDFDKMTDAYLEVIHRAAKSTSTK